MPGPPTTGPRTERCMPDPLVESQEVFYPIQPGNSPKAWRRPLFNPFQAHRVRISLFSTLLLVSLSIYLFIIYLIGLVGCICLLCVMGLRLFFGLFCMPGRIFTTPCYTFEGCVFLSSYLLLF